MADQKLAECMRGMTDFVAKIATELRIKVETKQFPEGRECPKCRTENYVFVAGTCPACWFDFLRGSEAYLWQSETDARPRRGIGENPAPILSELLHPKLNTERLHILIPQGNIWIGQFVGVIEP